MLFLWPAALLFAPLCVTLAGGRSVFLWGSLFLGAAALYGMAVLSSYSLASGGPGRPLGPLFANTDDPTDISLVFHFAELRRLTLTYAVTLLPTVALLWPSHPVRAPWDVALFWGFATLALAHLYLPTLMLGREGMPPNYVDFSDRLAFATGLARTAGGLAVLTLVLAVLRPIFVAIRKRLT
ncbi:hypothetical protein [Pseudooctadecabacter jejudonensis]|uniref:Uncharacterized protein n=1 Tax=Pseudooctadecabacter jejudonensis TaxID=1391910 RepID=A0A1Y5SFE6_9RHOB|nr:hypothetical protein [Pseudooctadecabacter jejudonensis]SLN39164.1 hypothetical protein PSJ8397_01931 [Pseudooctadecabacter jejudonensis]